MLYSCQSSNANVSNADADSASVKLVTLDPGHFHAALVQKSMYPQIDSTVYVYAPAGAELDAHLALVKQYNNDDKAPTHWKEVTYTGADFFQKMLQEKKGNLVVLAGNNQLKTTYIKRSIEAGLNVLGDKPMAINTNDFTQLEQAFSEAKQKNLLLYDIMTERSEITNILQKEFAHIASIFGSQQQGTENDPGVIIESIHYFYKYVSGNVLTRPDWFFDSKQQGESIADVGTHLIDLVQWELFPETAIDYTTDVHINKAKTWPTPVTLSQFAAITKKQSFPQFLQSYVTHDTILQTHANGEVHYTLKNVHVKLTARWDYKAPESSGDRHYSLLKGTVSNLEIRQEKEEDYKPTLYIIPKKNDAAFETNLRNAVQQLQHKYEGVSVEKTGNKWRVNIPEKYKVGHEAHFAQVMQRYLQYLQNKQMPAWEVPCMLSKYYTSTKALEIANK